MFRKTAAWGAIALACLAGSQVAQAQNYPVTAQQRAVAQQAASRGVPVSDLRANAPQTYTVKAGDTLWGISAMYLNKPWRWPELWGMNMSQIRNPHLIYPGQVLHLDVRDGYARLGLGAGSSGDGGVVRLSPHVRSEQLEAVALPTIQRELIRPFLVRPVVKNLEDLERLPVVLASVDERLVMGKGDKIYVRGTDNVPLSTRGDVPRDLSIFRDVKPLVDPDTKEILGYEGEHVGEARVVADEFFEEGVDKKGRPVEQYFPATLEIMETSTEVRIGDRLERMQESAEYTNFMPRVPGDDVSGKVISIYSDMHFRHATSNQVVAINLGTEDGLEPGHVLQIFKSGRLVRDPEGGPNARVRLPDEENGLLLIFRVFDRVAYGLIVDSRDGVQIGDKLKVPQ